MAETDTEAEAKPASTNVLVIYTGGTIGMVPSEKDNPNSPLRPAPKEDLVKFIPNPIEGVGWDLVGLADENGEPVGPLDSSSVGPRHWVQMAQAVQANYQKYDGFVVLHGTDTMAFTASALSFLLQHLDKPVIITGSQLPIFQARTDAKLNFINALYIAGYKATALPRIPEVVICFGDAILRGNRTSKVSTSRWQGFDSPNFPRLGRIGEHIVIEQSLLLPPPDQGFFAHRSLVESVAAVPIYPGMSPAVLDSMLGVDVKAFVLRTFGNGNAPEDPEFLAVIKRAVDADKILVNTTQCLEGTVEMGLYAASAGLQEAGVITGLDLTPEAALTKLMLLMATEGNDVAEVRRQMQIAVRGEQTASVFEMHYGAIGSKAAPVEAVTLKQSPSGQFQTAKLSSAMLRLSGVGVEGAKKGDRIEARVFVNLPGADASTSDDAPQFAGIVSGVVGQPGETILFREIGPVVARVLETGRPLHISIIPGQAGKLWARSMSVNLFCR